MKKKILQFILIYNINYLYIVMDNFISIKNFIFLFGEIKKYALNNYNEKIKSKDYKKKIGIIMEEIDSNKNINMTKNKANKICLKILYKIVDDEYNKPLFKTDEVIHNFNHFHEMKIEKQDDLIIPQQQNTIIYDPNQKISETIIDRNNQIEERPINDVKNLFIRDTVKDEPKKSLEKLQEELLISPEEFNKTKQKYIKQEELIIDTRDINTDIYNLNDFNVKLQEGYNNLISIELISAEIPNSQYNVNSNNNILHFSETNGTIFEATITEGHYTDINNLLTEIQTQMNIVGSSSYTIALTTDDKIIISSDLTGGGGIFELYFLGKKISSGYNNFQKTTYKTNSIGELLGFLQEDYSGSSNYTTTNNYNLDTDKQLYIYINKLDNTNTISNYSSDLFTTIMLESDFGDYTYFKNPDTNADKNFNKSYIYIPQDIVSLNNISLQIRDYNNNLYNFYGINYNLHFRIKYYNFENKIYIK
jgi:hypothetical protein